MPDHPKENISPEEKLLRLIKNVKKPDHFSAGTSRRQDVLAEKRAVPPVSELKRGVKNTGHTLVFGEIVSGIVPKLIPVIFIISLLYLLASFIYPWIGLKNIKLPKVDIQKTKEAEPAPKQEVLPYASYLEGISKRKIFTSTGAGAPQTTTGISQVADADLIKDINLVGIIAGDNPQAIVEDKKAQKTYYLNKGQFISEFQIEDIGEGKIALSRNGQRYELFL